MVRDPCTNYWRIWIQSAKEQKKNITNAEYYCAHPMWLLCHKEFCIEEFWRLHFFILYIFPIIALAKISLKFWPLWCNHWLDKLPYFASVRVTKVLGNVLPTSSTWQSRFAPEKTEMRNTPKMLISELALDLQWEVIFKDHGVEEFHDIL